MRGGWALQAVRGSGGVSPEAAPSFATKADGVRAPGPPTMSFAHPSTNPAASAQTRWHPPSHHTCLPVSTTPPPCLSVAAEGVSRLGQVCAFFLGVR